MAAPSFVDAQTGATDAGGTWSYTCQASGAAGRVFIVQIFQDGTTIPSPNGVNVTGASNIENLAGTDNAWTTIVLGGDSNSGVGNPDAGYQHIFIGRALSTSAPTISGTNGTSEDIYIRSYQFTDVSTGTTLATVIENGTAGSIVKTVATDGTITDAGVTTIGPDRLALNFVAISDDNAIAAFTGESGGDWTLATAGYAESSGTDGSIALEIAYPATFSQTSLLGGIAFVQGGTSGSGQTNQQQAESFTTTGAITVAELRVALSKTGSHVDNLIVEIQTDNANAPSGTPVTNGTASVSGALLTGSATWYTLPITPSLSAATKYWIVFSRSGVRDTTNYYFISYGNGNPFSGDSAVRSNTTWTLDTTTNDFAFAVVTAADQAGATINGGTTTNADATDGWGVVGFALIGTTVAAAYVPRNPGVHFNDPAIV